MKKVHFITILLIISVSVNLLSAEKKGYNIKLEINELPDTIAYLAYYYTDKTYLSDTARQAKDGTFIFKGDIPLEQGIYIIAGQNNNKIIEFLVTEDQHFSFESNMADITGNMEVSGSKENELFFQYINFLSEKRKEILDLQNIYYSITDYEDSLNLVKNMIDIVDKEVESFRKNMITNNQGTFFKNFILSTMEPEIPDPPKDEQGNIDSSFAYKYFKYHYWDNIDLSDERLLRTPFFYNKMDSYFSQLVVPNIDSTILEIDRMLSRVEQNEDVFNYFLWNLTIKYERSEYMGMDAVFVDMVNKYYKTGKADWLNETVKKNIIDRADVLEPLLIGKPAPEMILQDTNLHPTGLYNINARFTLIYFWDTDCGFCKKETPKLVEFYNNNHKLYNFEVYGVCMDTSMVLWKKYIRENRLTWINVNGYRSYTPDFHDLYDVHSSPVLYLLDETKMIIAKRILTEQLEGIMRRSGSGSSSRQMKQ